MRITDQYFWNIVFSLFFVFLVAMGTLILDSAAYKTYAELALGDFVLMTLASWRLVRLFVYDKIMACVREQFWDAKVTKTSVTLTKPQGGPRRTIADLFSCPWCFGVWGTACVVFFYLLTPYAFFPVLILALSAVATFLQILTNMIEKMGSATISK
ncbi:MAG: DUF1360 domain-containing protein [Candidatus Pacebacteria bacterium]|nr:DUF1360 domain-containing protein [Candidatus Paceibacterota bacterium]